VCVDQYALAGMWQVAQAGHPLGYLFFRIRSARLPESSFVLWLLAFSPKNANQIKEQATMPTISERASLRVKVVWSGAAESEPVSLQGRTAGLRIYLPAGFSGSSLAVQERIGGNWKNIAVEGSPVSYTVAADAVNVLSGQGELFGVGEIRFVSSGSETGEGILAGTA